MLKEVMDILDQIGYTCKPNDQTLIAILMDKISSDIKSYTNTVEVPAEMHYDIVLAVAGELLLIRKGSGQLEIANLRFEGFMSVKEGDTTITYAEGATDEAKFSSLIKYMTDWKKKALRFRRLVW